MRDEDRKKKERGDGVEWHVRRATSLLVLARTLTRIQPPASVISLRFTFISLHQETIIIPETSIMIHPVYSVQLASAHCSDYAIEIPVARSQDADPSLVMTVMLGPPRRSMHTSGHRIISSNFRIPCNAQPRQSRGQDLHDPETMEQAYCMVGCLNLSVSSHSGSAAIASYRSARKQKKVRLLWAWKLPNR